jgi:membrane protease YdiL (CAAX protease family)
LAVLAGFAFTLLYALLISPLNFGEEWGWRGYLLPQLLPLGQWRALLLTGIVWGTWHVPLILLGFDYPQHPLLGVLMIIGTCLIFGVILGWLRLASGSVWPAVLGHAAIDASAAAILAFGQAGQPIDTSQVTLLGWTGWLLPSLFIGILVLTRRLPVPGLTDHGAEIGAPVSVGTDN